jgi:hypothetical protein
MLQQFWVADLSEKRRARLANADERRLRERS